MECDCLYTVQPIKKIPITHIKPPEYGILNISYWNVNYKRTSNTNLCVASLFIFIFYFLFFLYCFWFVHSHLLLDGKAFAIDWLIKYFLCLFVHENYFVLFTSKYVTMYIVHHTKIYHLYWMTWLFLLNRLFNDSKYRFNIVLNFENVQFKVYRCIHFK